MEPPFLSAKLVRELVPMGEAIEALRTAFAERPVLDPRSIVNLSDGPPLRTFLSMPARSGGASGAKLVTLFEENTERGKPAVQGVYVLFSAVDGRVRAILDGAVLTEIRTPAASALASDYLAAPGVDRLGLFGTGVQAAAHLEAMLAVRPEIRRVDVVSGTPGRAAEFAVRAAERYGLEASEVTGEVAASAPLISTTTRAWSHLFTADQLSPGAHISAVGAFLPTMAEFGSDVVSSCDVWVDDLGSAQAEAGELIQAAEGGEWSWSSVKGDLSDLIASGPTHRSDRVSIFRNVGLSIEDLIVAVRAADNAGIAP